VDEDIDAAELFFDMRKEISGAGGGDAMGGTRGSVSADCCCCFGGSAAVAVTGDCGSGLRERNGDRGTETAGGAGDEGNFIIEPEAVEGVR
jgi:hypothetical protein